VSNAVKCTPPGGCIEASIKKVMCHEEVEYIQYSISDSGIGMNDEDLNRLFQRSATGKSTGYKERPGTGLGKSLSAKISSLILTIHQRLVDRQAPD